MYGKTIDKYVKKQKEVYKEQEEIEKIIKEIIMNTGQITQKEIDELWAKKVQSELAMPYSHLSDETAKEYLKHISNPEIRGGLWAQLKQRYEEICEKVSKRS